MWPHAAHEAQGTHARAKMTGQGQFLHVLMRMGCGDELPETAAEICALAGGVRPSVELPVMGTHRADARVHDMCMHECPQHNAHAAGPLGT